MVSYLQNGLCRCLFIDALIFFLHQVFDTTKKIQTDRPGSFFTSKLVTIQKYIGRKPVFAAGNSDGDLQMLQWAASNKYKNFELFVHHTDSTREWAYDRNSHIGAFNKGWDEAIAKKWAIADMRNDWKVIYP